MKAWKAALLGTCGAILVLGLPAAATAKPHFVVRPKSLVLVLTPPDSNGYKLTLVTAGHKQVELVASKGSTLAAYAVRGRVNRHGIDADFGQFGRISVRFNGVRRPPLETFESILFRDCRGRPTVREVGTFHGKIEFEGQHGFVTIRGHKLSGEVTRSYRRVCRSAIGGLGGGAGSHPQIQVISRPNREEEPGSILLAAYSKVAAGVAYFVAAGSEPGPRSGPGEGISVEIGGLEQQVGPVHVSLAALSINGAGALIANKVGTKPDRATVALPKPFSGTASYRGGEGGAEPSWTGSLGVHLPGAGLLHLTGPGFKAKLCDNSGAPGKKGPCERELEAELPSVGGGEAEPLLLQGSGSHSQALAEARLSWSRYLLNSASSAGSTP